MSMLNQSTQGKGAMSTEQYIVVESGPGYMPGQDEPAEFDNYADAVAYANELADELEEQGYECDRSWASSQNTYAISCTTSEKIHDLGRTIEVLADES